MAARRPFPRAASTSWLWQGPGRPGSGTRHDNSYSTPSPCTLAFSVLFYSFAALSVLSGPAAPPHRALSRSACVHCWRGVGFVATGAVLSRAQRLAASLRVHIRLAGSLPPGQGPTFGRCVCGWVRVRFLFCRLHMPSYSYCKHYSITFYRPRDNNFATRSEASSWRVTLAKRKRAEKREKSRRQSFSGKCFFLAPPPPRGRADGKVCRVRVSAKRKRPSVMSQCAPCSPCPCTRTRCAAARASLLAAPRRRARRRDALSPAVVIMCFPGRQGTASREALPAERVKGDAGKASFTVKNPL